MLGRVYAWIGRYDKSEEWFDRALSIYPDLYYSKLGNARLPLLSRGDVKQARILLEALPQHVLTDYNWYLLCMLERSYEELLDRLASSPHDSFFEAQFYIPKDLAFASVYYQIKDLPKMKTHAESARNLLEKKISENPDDPRFHASLGLAYAYLDRKDDAVREGKRAVEIYPVSRDAFEAPRHILNLAVIYSVVGEYDEAIEQLEYLLSIPCGNNYSVSMLRLNPVWDPLRENPRFQRLLRERPERKLPG
jgi:tetratricopeptide (TPR) repeat protein